MSLKRSHEPNEAAEPATKRPNRAPKPSWKKREGDGNQPTQPTKLNQKAQQVPMESLETTPDPLETTPEPPEITPERSIEPPTQPENRTWRPSPRPILQASQASRSVDEPAWELQLVANKPLSASAQPRAFSSAATEASVEDAEEPDVDFKDYESVDWKRLKGFAVPLSTPKGKPSWVYKYGWRLWKEHTKPEKLFFLCRYCHTHRQSGGLLEVTAATSSANTHLRADRVGHRLSKDGPVLFVAPKKTGQQSIREALGNGLQLTQKAYQELGNFNVQGFRQAAVMWLVKNHRPLREFETEPFREMIRFANPEAEAALWKSHNSVSAFVMKLYSWLQPQVKRALSEASSKIHISFDGWTTKGGKRGFFAIVAHYSDAQGKITDLPIALPQLVGAHTGEAIADAVAQILRYFDISSNKLGYFVLDNAYNNNTAVNQLGLMYGFKAADRRLRCACHILNLVGQTIMFSRDSDAYDNAPEHIKEEEFYMKEWRKDGPLGVFLDIINYINTPKQWAKFHNRQLTAAADLPAGVTVDLREIVKPCVTRWNSYFDAFQRGVELQQAINAYASFHIQATEMADEQAKNNNRKLPDAPRWMRSGGLTSADWAVITEYIEVLQPLKSATNRLQGRGKAGTHGALYEVIPVFESLISDLDARLRPFKHVDHEPFEAPEDHLAINLRAARKKAADYLEKLLTVPVYYAATALHPRYKTYFKVFWRNKHTQLSYMHARFQLLWSEYKPTRETTLTAAARKAPISSFDEAIDSALDNDNENIIEEDELESWLREPMWTSDQYKEGCTAVQYWRQLQPKYPNLSQLALDVLTIPASSADCERLFSETGDIMEPQRRKLGSQLLAALVCIQRWDSAGFKPPSATATAEYDDNKLTKEFSINKWEEPEPAIPY
jgi:hypothetical protein